MVSTGKAALSPFRAARHAFRDARARSSALAVRNQAKTIETFDSGIVEGAYFVTTERGLLEYRRGTIRRIFSFPAYGIAFDSRHLFVAAWLGRRSCLLRGDASALHEPGRSFGFEEIYALDVTESNARIHQIFLRDGVLFVANTGRDTILRISADTGEIVEEIPVFFDSFGSPIIYDNHHLNSVSVYGSTILFVAYAAGDGSLLGVFDAEARSIEGFRYRNRGVHDLFLTNGGFIGCDTFACKEASDRHGCVFDEQGAIDGDFWRSRRAFPRGIAGSDGEWLVGSSFEGSRKERFKGRGEIFVFGERRNRAALPLPASQVYQIIRDDGVFIEGPEDCRPDEIRKCLTSALGEPVYQVKAPRMAPGFEPHKAFLHAT